VGKQQVVQEDDKEKDEETTFHVSKRVLKVIYDHSDSDSSIDEHHKQLHVMYGGSWDITSRGVIKTLHRVVAVAAPALGVTPH
jgi:hypothetical protein